MHPPPVIGHRGAAAVAPENTLASFRRAAAEGARWVEFDVQRTADGVPVVFHDPTLDRTTSGSGPLNRLPLAALKGLDAGSWFGPDFAGECVPTLEEALLLLVRLGLGANIEVKASESEAAATAEAALAVARDVWPPEAPAPLISSFAPAALAKAREAAPDWPRGLLVGRLTPEALNVARELGCVSLHLDHRHLDALQVRDTRAAGLVPVAWTVNEADRARRLWDWGVAAIITDVPGRLLAASPRTAADGREGEAE